MVELHVLTCRELADAAAVAIRDLADRAQLRGLDEAGRQLDAQHERADLRLVVVEAPPLEAHDVLLGHRLVARGDQRRELVADAERRLVALDALDGIALVDEVPVGLGSLASRSDGRAHGHLHDGMQLPPLRDTVYARRRSQADVATRVLAQTTGAPNVVSGGRYRWAGSVVRGTAPLDARHPPSHLARRVWHLALWAGCRGVIGPEPSTSPDVERTCPRPPGSIQHAPNGGQRRARSVDRSAREPHGGAILRYLCVGGSHHPTYARLGLPWTRRLSVPPRRRRDRRPARLPRAPGRSPPR